ncbi:hypothetical protein F2Q68_00026174 [Brassica cretica]|uniref:Uncharacterized protein n=1 Tax=Brassica cretica TaxID=69181 RepID=A0A8S9IBR8_BRACR|nr:hypothetical protein F2Q68_00026174 [Brassica cretica]
METVFLADRFDLRGPMFLSWAMMVIVFGLYFFWVRISDWVWSWVKLGAKNSPSPQSLMCLRSSGDLGNESDLHGVFETIGVLMEDGKRIIHIVAIIPFTALSSSVRIFLEIVLIPYCFNFAVSDQWFLLLRECFWVMHSARKKRPEKRGKKSAQDEVARKSGRWCDRGSWFYCGGHSLRLLTFSIEATSAILESSGPTAVRGPDAGVGASMVPPSFLVLPLPPTRGSLPESIPKEAALEASRCSSDNRDRRSELSHSLAAFFSSLAAYFSSLAAYFCFMSTPHSEIGFTDRETWLTSRQVIWVSNLTYMVYLRPLTSCGSSCCFLLKMVKLTVAISRFYSKGDAFYSKKRPEKRGKKSAQDEVARKAASEVVAGATAAHGSTVGVTPFGVPEVRKSLSDVLVATEAAALAPPSSSVTAGVLESSGPTAVRGPDAGVEASMAPPSFLVIPLPPTRGSLPESIPKEAALEASRCSSDNRDQRSELSHSFLEFQRIGYSSILSSGELSSQALQLTSQVLQLTSQVLQLTSASCQQSRNSLRPLSASSSFYKSQRWGLEIDLIKRSTLGSGQRDLIGLKRSQTDDGLNLRAGTSYSSWKDAYAMSFKFPGYTSFSNDGKAYVHCYSEVCLGRDFSFSEDMFTKNDSYKGLCRSYALHLGWVNSNWVQYECKIQDARWVAADSEKETLRFWQLSSQVLQLTSQVLQLTSASCQQSRNSLRPSSASSSFDKSQRWGLEIDLMKRSTLGSGQRDLIGLKRSQTDDGLNLRAGTSYSSWKDAYAMSFEFPGYTSLSNDGKAYVHCYREVCLGRDLSFSEDMFTKNDSYKGLCRSYALHLGWVNSNWVQYECKIQDARWVAADSEKETLRCKDALRAERAKNQEIYLIRKISIN